MTSAATPAVLVDTGPLYAAVDPGDQHHSRAHAELEVLAEQGAAVFVLYPTLLEAFTLIRKRLGFGVGAQFLSDIADGASAVNPDPADYRAAARRVLAYDDQLITLFDAVVAVVGERLRIPVWTYDTDFDVMRVPVWR